ncbi:MAG: glycosyltransferase [Aquamicrobium sp.]|nr:glycosyltransferase [Aquamicrobium sp.]
MKSIRTTFICNDGEYFLRHRRQVADVLAAAGHRVTVIVGGPPLSPERLGRWRHVNVPVDRFTFHPLSDLRLFFASLREIAVNRPRYVQLITLKPAVFSGLAAITARLVGRGPECIVVTIPGLGRLMSPVSEHDGAGSGIARKVVGQVIRFLSRRKKVFFTFETPTDREHWLSLGYIKAETSTAISGAGVDPSRFHPGAPRKEHGAMRVLFASRLLRAKGLDAFVDVARRLSASGQVEFVVAGMVEPHDPDGYAPAQLAGEPSITFLGESSDMPSLLRSVDLVCLPTRYGEGIPRILIEAAATGVPSIASDVPGCTHIVEHGVSGSIIPVSPPAGMADRLETAIRLYLDNPALLRSHGTAAYAHFQQGEFTEDAVNRRIIELLTGAPPPATDAG